LVVKIGRSQPRVGLKRHTTYIRRAHVSCKNATLLLAPGVTWQLKNAVMDLQSYAPHFPGMFGEPISSFSDAMLPSYLAMAEVSCLEDPPRFLKKSVCFLLSSSNRNAMFKARAANSRCVRHDRWFQSLCSPLLGKMNPFSLIFFRWIETTNQNFI